VVASIVFLIGLALLLALLYIARPMLFSLAVSFALFAVLSPAVDHLRRHGWHTAKAASGVMVMATLAVSAVGAVLYPVTIMQIHQVSQQAMHLDQQLNDVLTHANSWLSGHDLFSFDPQQLTTNIIQTVEQKTQHIVLRMEAFFSQIAASLLLIPLITFFLLCDFHALRNQALQLLPNRQFELGWLVYARAAKQLHYYIRGISIQALIMASVCTLGFWLAGVDYAPLLGITIGLLNTIPFFGISLAKIPPVMVVLISNDPNAVQIVLALGVVLVAQAIDNGYVIPKIIAKAANLHPLTVMIGVMLGGYYIGFAGLVLMVPILFSLKVILFELVRGLRRQAEHRRLTV